MTGEPIPGTLAGPAGGAADTESAEQPWQRLAVGMLLVEPVREIIRFIPMLVILIFAGRAGQSGPPWGLIGTGAVIALGISRWLTTRYRITPTVVEVRRGVFQRKHVTVPRDRVRTVDVSAHPLQRALRLVQGAHRHRVVPPRRAGAGAGRPASRRRRPAAGAAAASGSAGTDRFRPGRATGDRAGPAGRTVGALRPGHVVRGRDTAAFLIGLGWRITSEASVDPTRLGIVRGTLGYLQGTPLWVDIFQGSAAVIVVITLLSLAGYVLAFWGYRLTRHPHGTLQVSRGLLTTRSISIEERRLRGVQRSEPLLLRAVGGARLQAVATGLRHHGSDRGGSERGGALLVPPAPLTTVVAVESAVLGSAEPATATLLAHGPAARRRRFTRAVGVTLVLIAALAALAGGRTGRHSRSPCRSSRSRWPRCWPAIGIAAWVTGCSATG